MTAVIVAGETLRKHLQLALQRISSDNVHNSPIGIGLGIETARHTVWETASGGRERTVGRRVRVQLGAQIDGLTRAFRRVGTDAFYPDTCEAGSGHAP